MIIGNRDFDTKHNTYIMGILNVTPDSFSDGGKWKEVDSALKHAEKMLKDGCDIIDVGGESTRPGYKTISDDEEIDRVLPVIEGIKKNFDVPVSLDTYKSKVARAGILCGADMINDIWGLKADSNMGSEIAKSGVCCCLMHNTKQTKYKDFNKELIEGLRESLILARNAGIKEDKIILDPGIGFGKNLQENLQIINHLDSLKELGFPYLLGASRKSVIGSVLDEEVNNRLEGTLATTVFAILRGASFVRVHDIKENVRVIKMTQAIMNS